MADHAHHHHDHGHTHDHDHHGEDTYFIDQLCMVGLSGAFGVICLCLYFGKLLYDQKMLANMLGEQFHIAVLLAGIALTIVAFTRAAILWRQSRDPTFRHGHDHHHDHHHGHSHEHAIKEQPPHAHGIGPLAVVTVPAATGADAHADCGHTHAPGEACGHDHHGHGHDHAHTAAPATDHDEADHDHGWAPWRYVVILVPIIFFLLGLPNKPLEIVGFQAQPTGFEFTQMILIFAGIVYEALPFIVAGVIVAGLLEEFVPQQAIAKIIPRNRVLAIMLGAILGMVFPMCECGIIVVMKRLLRKGLPLSVCVAYMLAGPVINGIVIWTTYVAFNPPDPKDYILGGPWFVIGWRVGLSYIVACTTALIVDWQWGKHGARLLHPSVARGLRSAAGADDGLVRRTAGERLDNITRTALHDFVDILAFLILGATLAVAGRYMLKQANVQELFEQTPAIAILLMMVIAVLFCLCSEADAFVAANFPLFWPPASKIAFLVLGPMLDLKLYLMYTRVFRTRLIFTIISSVVAQVFVYSLLLHAIDDTPVPVPVREPVYISPEAETTIRFIAIGPDPFTQIVHVGVAAYPPPSGKGDYIDFKQLYQLAEHPDTRYEWETPEGKERLIEVRGQYSAYRGSEQIFMLARYKVGCCPGDGQQLDIPVIARERITGHANGAWLKATGKVVFRKEGNSYRTVVMASSAGAVVSCNPDPNPYIK